MGLGTQVRLKWLIIADIRTWLAGAGRSDMLPLGEPRDARSEGGMGGGG